METLRLSPRTMELLGNGCGNVKVAVDDDVVRLWFEIGHSHGHGEPGGLQDIDAVDFNSINNADTHGPGLLIDPQVQRFPLSPSQFFWNRLPPRSSKSNGRITAAETTGPARGPLPASSTPAI